MAESSPEDVMSLEDAFDAFDRVLEDERPDPLSADALRASVQTLLRGNVPPCAPRAAPIGSLGEYKRTLRLVYSNDHVLRTNSEGQCVTLVISFSSLVERGHSQHEFVGTTKRAGATHALFLADPQQSWFLRGNDACDPFVSVLAVVVREIQLLHPARVVCIGASMGGYAAIRCGFAIAALVSSVRVVSFGPQVVINPAERAALNLPLASFEPALDRLYGAARAIGMEMASLVELFARGEGDHLGGEVRVEIHVGREAPGDEREARLLACVVHDLETKAASGAMESNAGQAVATSDAASCTPPHGGEHGAGGVHVSVQVHEGSAHTVAADLKTAGSLDAIIAAHILSSTPCQD